MKHLWKIILIIVIIVLLFFVYQSFALNPERVSKSMLKKMTEVNTYHYTANITIDGDVKGKTGNIKLIMNADIDSTDPNIMKTSGITNLALQTEGIQISGALEFKSFQNIAYLRLTEFPSMIGNLNLPVAVNKYKNMWIKISADKYKKIDEAQAKAIQEELKKWMKDTQLFSKVEKLAPETIDGKKCFHYNITINKDSITELIQRINNVTKNPTDPEEMDKIKENLNKMGDLKAEIWIGKKDKLLYKLKTSTEITPEKLEGKINLTIDATFSKYNEKMDIQEPVEVKNLEELIGEVMPQVKVKPGTTPAPGMPILSPEGSPMPGATEAPTIPTPETSPATTP